MTKTGQNVDLCTMVTEITWLWLHHDDCILLNVLDSSESPQNASLRVLLTLQSPFNQYFAPWPFQSHWLFSYTTNSGKGMNKNVSLIKSWNNDPQKDLRSAGDLNMLFPAVTTCLLPISLSGSAVSLTLGYIINPWLYHQPLAISWNLGCIINCWLYHDPLAVSLTPNYII